MPELPEVETMRRGIAALSGARILEARFPVGRCRPLWMRPAPGRLAEALGGAVIGPVTRHGKRVAIALASGGPDAWLMIEPRMTGLLLIADPPTEKHLRMELLLDGAGQHPPGGPREPLEVVGPEAPAGDAGVDGGAVEDLGGVDVADPRHRPLVEEGHLHGTARRAEALGERLGGDDEPVGAEGRAAAGALEPGRGAAALSGAMLLPGEMQIRPSRHLDALEASCRRRGVVVEEAEVREFVVRQRRLERAVTATGSVSSGTWILAAGAWTGGLLGHFGVSLDTRPIRGQVESAGADEAVVDAGLGSQFRRPFPVEPVAPGRERVGRGAVRENGRRRKDAGGGPGGGVGAAAPRQDAHADAAAGELTRERQADDPAADDAAVCHGRRVRRWSPPRAYRRR